MNFKAFKVCRVPVAERAWVSFNETFFLPLCIFGFLHFFLRNSFVQGETHYICTKAKKKTCGTRRGSAGGPVVHD